MRNGISKFLSCCFFPSSRVRPLEHKIGAGINTQSPKNNEINLENFKNQESLKIYNHLEQYIKKLLQEKILNDYRISILKNLQSKNNEYFKRLMQWASHQYIDKNKNFDINQNAVKSVENIITWVLDDNPDKELSFYKLQLHQLPELPNNLQKLCIESNQLSKLPEHLPASLVSLNAANNNITKFPKKIPEKLSSMFLFCNKINNLSLRDIQSLKDMISRHQKVVINLRENNLNLKALQNLEELNDNHKKCTNQRDSPILYNSLKDEPLPNRKVSVLPTSLERYRENINSQHEHIFL